MLILKLQGNCLGSFCNHMVCFVVNNANEGTLTMEPMHRKLSKRRQSRIRRMSSWSKRVVAGWKRVESAVAGGPCSDIAIEGVIDREFSSTVVSKQSANVSTGVKGKGICPLQRSWYLDTSRSRFLSSLSAAAPIVILSPHPYEVHCWNVEGTDKRTVPVEVADT